MSKILYILVAMTCLIGLLALSACTRDITTVQEVDAGASNCFTCHTDDPSTDQYGLVAKELQWAYSGHGTGNYVGYAGGRSGCSGCHSGAGFVARLAGETAVPYPTTIGCWNCHAPHSTGDFGLRVIDPQPSANGALRDIGSSNICTACHVARHTVAETVVQDYPDSTGLDQVTVTSTHWGGHHGPQGDVFFGENGYEYAGYTYRRAVPPAHDLEGMTRCFGCHGNDNTKTPDLGGHSFQQTNEAGKDNVASCNRCHSDLEDFDYNGVQTGIEAQMAQLAGILEGVGLLTPEGGLIAHVSGTEAQVGALWNYITVEEDRSMGVHNPDYIEDLMTSSLEALGAGGAAVQ